MEKFKVKKKHLTGDIADFPMHVVQAMVDEQVRQGNKADPSVFAYNLYADKATGGFSWGFTHLGHDVWHRIIKHRQFGIISKPEGNKKART